MQSGDVVSSFIDRPVRALLEYFTSTSANFLAIALRLARLTALCGILWSAIQVAFGTMETRKFFVGTLTKFFAFLAIMSLYPVFSHGLQKFAVAVGTEGSGVAVSTITQQLADYMGSLQKVVDGQQQDLEEAIRKAESIQENITSKTQEKGIYWGRWSDNNKLFDAQMEVAYAQAQIEASKKNKNGAYQKILAIQSVLTTSDGDDLTPHYALDLDMKDSTGKSTGYLSVDAIARMSVLAGEIMKDNEWVNDVMVELTGTGDKWDTMTDEEKDKFREEVRSGKKKTKLMDFSIGALFRYGLVCIAVLFLLITTIGCLIQYIMAIIEYTICSSYSILLVPCMLFDGLKDMASKVLPMLLAQAVKLSILTYCMFFNAYTYMRIAMDTVAASNSFGLQDFFYVVFTGFLTFVLCVNGPKLASVIMTGQPQMSMGEFMQAGAAIAGGAMAAKSAVQWANKKLAGGAKMGVNAKGTLDAAVGAYNGSRAANGSRGKAFGAAMGEIGSRATGSLKQKGMNWLNTGSIHGGPQGNVTKPSAGSGNSLPPMGSGGSGGSGGGSPSGGDLFAASQTDSQQGSSGGDSPSGGGVPQTSEAVAQNGAPSPSGQGSGGGGSEGVSGADRIVGVDANMNPVSARFSDSVAQRYEDAMSNNGASYTGKMGVGEYWRTQKNNAYLRAMQKQMSKPPKPKKKPMGGRASNVHMNLIAPNRQPPLLPPPSGNPPLGLPAPSA